MLSYHLLLGKSQMLPNLKCICRSTQSSYQRWSKERDMLCVFVFSFLSVPMEICYFFFPPQKLLPLFRDMRASTEAVTTNPQSGWSMTSKNLVTGISGGERRASHCVLSLKMNSNYLACSSVSTIPVQPACSSEFFNSTSTPKVKLTEIT